MRDGKFEFTIVRQLGAGGMGQVYLAQHPRLPRRDALKVLNPQISDDDTFRQRFIQEADIAAALTHSHIVTVYDRGDTDGTLWIATQFVDGTDTAQLIRDRYPAGMPVDEAVVRKSSDSGLLRTMASRFWTWQYSRDAMFDGQSDRAFTRMDR